MAKTVEEARAELEVWQNTSSGAKWYVCYDRQGRETTKVVKGGRTFTISSFERQINQDLAASPEMDLFRNGTFVLKKESAETDRAEIESPDALTDAEIEEMVREVMHGSVDIADVIADISSLVTMNRIYEALVVEDASASTIEKVKTKIAELDPSRPIERTVVTTAPAAGIGDRGPKKPRK